MKAKSAAYLQDATKAVLRGKSTALNIYIKERVRVSN